MIDINNCSNQAEVIEFNQTIKPVLIFNRKLLMNKQMDSNVEAMIYRNLLIGIIVIFIGFVLTQHYKYRIKTKHVVINTYAEEEGYRNASILSDDSSFFL